jgi:hypothetical protein
MGIDGEYRFKLLDLTFSSFSFLLARCDIDIVERPNADCLVLGTGNELVRLFSRDNRVDRSSMTNAFKRSSTGSVLFIKKGNV